MKNRSLFYPLDQEGLTTLRIQYDWKTGDSCLQASKDWDEDLDWSRYNHDFYLESVKTKTARLLNDGETRAIFEKHGVTEYLNEVLDLLRQGRHFGIDCLYHKGYDIKFLGNMHNRKRGINNTRFGILQGGIRRHAKADPELEVIIDGLNLARAMTFKNIAGELPVGGSKSCVIMDELDLTNLKHVGFLGFCIDELRTGTGPDMGFPPEMTDVMKDQGYSVQYTCGPKGPLGASGKPTAYGVYLAMKEAVKFVRGTDDMTGMSFAVQGLGQVGWHLAEYLAEGEKNIKLFVTDVYEPTIKKFVDNFKAKGVDVTGVKPEEILFCEADVICPCACGGVLDENTIPKLKCSIIFGGANNQIKASSVEEECRLARIIAERGILFQTDWWHNTAGVMFGYEEYKHQNDASLDRIYQDIKNVLPKNTRLNLNKAKELGITPTECAYQTCHEVIYGDR